MQRVFWRERFKRAAVILERAQARGEVGRRFDAAPLLEQLIAPLYFRLLVSHEPNLDGDLETRVDAIIAQTSRATRSRS